MIWVSILIGFVFVFELRNYWPVRGLQYIGVNNLSDMKRLTELKIIDIRDAADFYEDHCADAINIYVGRLPFVWHDNISKGDIVVLLGSDRKSINKAARILRKHVGFKRIHAAFYQSIRTKMTIQERKINDCFT